MDDAAHGWHHRVWHRCSVDAAVMNDVALQLLKARQAISLAALERERLLPEWRKLKIENQRLRMMLMISRRTEGEHGDHEEGREGSPAR